MPTRAEICASYHCQQGWRRVGEKDLNFPLSRYLAELTQADAAQPDAPPRGASEVSGTAIRAGNITLRRPDDARWEALSVAAHELGGHPDRQPFDRPREAARDETVRF